MKQIKVCYNCGSKIKEASIVKDGIELNGMRCDGCGEEFFTSSELMRYEVLSGKRKMVRKFGVLGDSSVIRIPEQIVEDYGIEPGDYGHFEKKDEGILIKLIHVKHK